MNYRHEFHAGNFADLVKHAALTLMLQPLTAGRAAVHMIDTHGGAGLYDLCGDAARRSGEGQAAMKLMADAAAPAAFDDLKMAVRAVNGGRDGPLYPGSPLIAAQHLRPGDRLTTCELQAEARSSLERALKFHPQARVLAEDGYGALSDQAPTKAHLLVLIDPPFERPDDYDRAADALQRLLAGSPAAQVMIWLPLKDLETLDAFLRRLDVSAPLLLAQVRLQPLTNPMKMNGCALLIANPGDRLPAPLAEACAWVAANCGGQGASSRVELLG